MDSTFPKPYDDDIQDVAEGMVIVIDGDTAPKAISAGQYLLIKNHSTLATGGYHATAAIGSGDAVSLSNVAVDADGIVNAAYSALNSKKVFGMNKITASSIEDLKTKLTSLADTMASETSTELVLVTSPAFSVFPNGTHSITFHKLASTYYWGYGFVSNHIVTFSRAGSSWTFSNDYDTLNSNIATYTKGSSTYTETITSGHTFTATKNCIFTIRFYAGFCGLVPIDSENGVCGPQCDGWNGGVGPTNSSTVSICLKKNAQCKIWTSATIVNAIIYDI